MTAGVGGAPTAGAGASEEQWSALVAEWDHFIGVNLSGVCGGAKH